jgi:hypothetical protein
VRRVLLALLCLTGVAGAAPPTAADLVRAARDPSELARIAERLGPKALRAHFAGAPEVRRAAFAAARLSPDAGRMLPWLAGLAGHPDADTAIGAADTAANIARSLEARGAEQEDLPPDVLAASAAACAEVARGDRDPAVRVAALHCALDVGRLAGTTLDLTEDPDPLVRRAAIPSAPRPIVVAKAGDPDDGVALAAAGWACAARAWTEIPPAVRARHAALVKDPTREPADLARVLRCLRASKDPAERKAATEVARSKKHPPPVRRVAKSG